MIKLKLLLEGQYDFGCVMAYVDEDVAKKILQFNLKVIPKDILYVKGDEYGREFVPHVTIKYGLTKSYSASKIEDIIKSIKPFKLKVKGISLFENDDFDVVKMDIDCDVLDKLNKKFSKLPNKDEFPDYHPHLTLAYIKKGHGKKFAKMKKKFSSLPVSTIVYSDKGDKSHYDL